MKPTLVIDGKNLGYIAFHAVGDLAVEDHQTGVLFGFFLQLFSLAQRFETGRFIFCWDSQQSYRRAIFKGYKNRVCSESTEGERVARIAALEQMDLLRREVLPGLGFKNVFYRTGFEADDLIAQVVKQLRGDAAPIIVSTDQDLYQLLDDASIYNPKTKAVIGREDFVKKWGIAPAVWAEVKALAGCSSDTVPGIPGVGEATAAKFLRGELKAGAKWSKIVGPEGVNIKKYNLPLVRLPFCPGGREPEPLKIFMGQEKLKALKFIDFFEEHEFAYFLKQENFKTWAELFQLEGFEFGDGGGDGQNS